MAERDRAAMRLTKSASPLTPELAQAVDALGGEGLVELDRSKSDTLMPSRATSSLVAGTGADANDARRHHGRRKAEDFRTR